MAFDPIECGNAVCQPGNYALIREEMDKCAFTLFNSGAVRVDESATELANSKSWEGNYHFYCDDIGYDEDGVVPKDEDLESDDCACETPSQKMARALRLQRNKCFSMEWCQEMCNRAQGDQESEIILGINKQQMSFRQGVMTNTILGIYKWAKENDCLIHDATCGKLVDPTCGGWFDYCSFIDACGGTCCEGDTNILYVHCDVFKDMKKCEQIQYIQPSAILRNSSLAQAIPTFNGHVVVQHNDDRFVDRTDPTKPCYTTVCLQNGFFRLGNGMHPRPLEPYSNPKLNNCDGGMSWFLREIFALLPAGFTNCWEVPEGSDRASIKNSELCLATTWKPCWEENKLGIRFLTTYAGKTTGKPMMEAPIVEGKAA